MDNKPISFVIAHLVLLLPVLVRYEYVFFFDIGSMKNIIYNIFEIILNENSQSVLF